MFSAIDSFSGFSVDDLAAAHTFYETTLGLHVESEGDMGMRVTMPSGAEVFVYGKPDHTPASFTILNFVVEDIDQAVDELNAAGVQTKIYSDDVLPTDEKGIAHGSISFHYDKGQWKLLGIGVEVPRDVHITNAEREKRVAPKIDL